MENLTRHPVSTLIRIFIFMGILASVHIADSNAQVSFKIKPYMLMHTNQQLLLNFQLQNDETLSIEDDRSAFLPRLFKKNHQYQVELSKAKCGEEKEIRIFRPNQGPASDANRGTLIFQKKMPKVECANKDNLSANSEDEFVFGFISDTQEYEDRHNEVARVIAHHHSLSPLQFIVNGGDVVQTGDDEKEWYKYFEGGKAYLMDIPQIAAIGNHDYRGHYKIEMPPLFKKYMRWENADPYGNLYYEFNHFNLIVFNSNFQISIGSKEKVILEWIERKIVESKNKGKPVIMATHFPAYSSSLNRYTAEGVYKIREYLVPVMEKYGVPLLLSGHTHMFERSFKNNVHYLVAGPAGGRPNSPSDKNPYKVVFDEKALTFTKITVSKAKIQIDTYNEANIIIDQVTIPLKK